MPLENTVATTKTREEWNAGVVAGTEPIFFGAPTSYVPNAIALPHPSDYATRYAFASTSSGGWLVRWGGATRMGKNTFATAYIYSQGSNNAHLQVTIHEIDPTTKAITTHMSTQYIWNYTLAQGGAYGTIYASIRGHDDDDTLSIEIYNGSGSARYNSWSWSLAQIKSSGTWSQDHFRHGTYLNNNSWYASGVIKSVPMKGSALKYSLGFYNNGAHTNYAQMYHCMHDQSPDYLAKQNSLNWGVRSYSGSGTIYPFSRDNGEVWCFYLDASYFPSVCLVQTLDSANIDTSNIDRLATNIVLSSACQHLAVQPVPGTDDEFLMMFYQNSEAAYRVDHVKVAGGATPSVTATTVWSTATLGNGSLTDHNSQQFVSAQQNGVRWLGGSTGRYFGIKIRDTDNDYKFISANIDTDGVVTDQNIWTIPSGESWGAGVDQWPYEHYFIPFISPTSANNTLAMWDWNRSNPGMFTVRVSAGDGTNVMREQDTFQTSGGVLSDNFAHSTGFYMPDHEMLVWAPAPSRPGTLYRFQPMIAA